MIPGAVRRLTEGETDLAAGVFGRALDAHRVRIAALPVWRRAFVAGPALVAWPARTAASIRRAAAVAADCMGPCRARERALCWYHCS